MPDHWIQHQALANEERIITHDLKERTGRIFQLREQVGAIAAPISQTASKR